MVEPVLEIHERRSRFSRMANLSMWRHPMHFASKLFLSHVQGLDMMRGRVLEIGGSDLVNLSSLFRRNGAEYVNVCLEGNPKGDNRVIVNDFMELELPPFDLIVSLGVFEEGGIDRNQDTHSIFPGRVDPQANAARLRKLQGLLAAGGSCVIGTISDSCMFSDSEIACAGFFLNHRQGPFYTFMSMSSGIYLHSDFSELLIMKRAG